MSYTPIRNVLLVLCLVVSCTWAMQEPADPLQVAGRTAPSRALSPGNVAFTTDTGGVPDNIVLADVAAVILLGEFAGDGAGTSVAHAGDVDGDGLDDVIIGAALSDVGAEDAGAAYVILGAPDIATDCPPGTGSPNGGADGDDDDDGDDGDDADDDDDDDDGGAGGSESDDNDDSDDDDGGSSDCTPGGRSLGTAQARLIGVNASDGAGFAVAGAGDVNNDGFDDLLVSAPGDDEGGTDAGAVYLIHGPVDGDVDLAAFDAKLIGEAAEDGVSAVAGPGDVNGDGFDDILVGAFGNDAAGDAAGAAYLVLGPVSGTVDLSTADAILQGVAKGDLAGASVSGAGDVNGDGFADLLIGATGNSDAASAAGAVYLVHGPVSGTQTIDLVADATLTGVAIGEGAGVRLAPGRDVDGDSVPDLLIGARTDSLDGIAYVVDGGVTGTSSLDTAATAILNGRNGDNAFVVASSDIDGDGLANVLVGAPLRGLLDPSIGVVYVVSDNPSGTVTLDIDAESVFVGRAADDRAGFSVAGAGDVNGDGIEDFVVGSLLDDAGAADAGAAYVVLGGS